MTNDLTEKCTAFKNSERVMSRMSKLIISDRKILIDSDTWF